MASKPLFLIGGITSERVQGLLEEIAKRHAANSDDEITLVISSGGGSQVAGTAFFDAVRSMNIKLTTIGAGYVGSMAVLMWLAGTTRRMTADTTCLIHGLSRTFEKETTLKLDEIEAIGQEMRQDTDLICGIIAEATDRPLSEIKKLSRKETYLTVTDLIALGLLRQQDVIPALVIPTKHLAP